jgi:hypothetical protein
MASNLYRRNARPFGLTWEEWVVIWYKWLLSIPRKKHPCIDKTGMKCAVNQDNSNVWFLAGTFGNTSRITRRCIIPSRKAVLLPLLVKQDSFAEDLDLTTEDELLKRSRDATERVLYMEAIIDENKIEHIEKFRVHSDVFDLRLIKNNIYNFTPGLTKSVCSGFWLFLKPFDKGRHTIYFKGETLLDEPFTRDLMISNNAYIDIKRHIKKNSTFKLEVLYILTVT